MAPPRSKFVTSIGFALRPVGRALREFYALLRRRYAPASLRSTAWHFSRNPHILLMPFTAVPARVTPQPVPPHPSLPPPGRGDY